MLSRTADNLYWLSRYVERAEFTARILETTLRLSSLPTSYGRGRNEWDSALLTVGATESFKAHHGQAHEETVCHFLAFSPDNPSSIKCCIETARTNARAVRTALTAEMWDIINSAWLELRSFKTEGMSREEFSRFLDWVKSISLAFDGTAYRTMLRNDAFWFSRLGNALERSDNTARLLDVKYHVLLPESEQVGGSLDYFQWTTLLRMVSALTAYHWVYRQSVKPWLVADLLILNRQLPRSLASCYEILSHNLDSIAEAYGRRGPSQRCASAMLNRLTTTKIEDLFQSGLHEFVTGFLRDNNTLGQAITEQYLI